LRPVADVGGWWDKRKVSIKGDEFDHSSAAVPGGALFVAADEPCLVFPSPAAAEQYLEAIDVENGLYTVLTVRVQSHTGSAPSTTK
jgi:hypothetical protein